MKSRTIWSNLDVFGRFGRLDFQAECVHPFLHFYLKITCWFIKGLLSDLNQQKITIIIAQRSGNNNYHLH